ncbi:LysR family transcriptional regulator [Acidiferrobacter sp.]|uniref:LysR family transcriptional regulator n=1 Tax=Acidiferrobacter sp. TaxID=1872107 RepID=UPI0026235745|nr:LysR family transcriptional regulator [Acidiferrobacter sp.]
MINHWTLQQLRLFEAVARHRSYTRAAEELCLTQPAVHIQVRRLEEIVGLPLIERVGKKLLLTRAGEEVYAATVAVMDQLRALTGEIADMKGKVAGPLKMAVVTSAKFFMPHFLGLFIQEYPDVAPQLIVTNRARVLERLTENLDDFVIMGQIPNDMDLTVRPFMDNLLVVVAHPDHPWADRVDIPLAEIVRERFLLREAGSGTRMSAAQVFAEQGLDVKPYMELGSSEAIKQAIMAGLGISVLALSSLELELEARRLVILDVAGFPLHRTWYAVHLQGKHLGLTASVFLDFLVKEGPDLGVRKGWVAELHPAHRPREARKKLGKTRTP